MYLKSLEIQGFKSFANKIVLQFHNGITGVVGPNGSGKSNISDAIRWVLGEQSAKTLRGGNMQDVIFAGTQTRRPMSYAYVAITLDNGDHALPVDYEEVTVSRRLYRSGESEYMINQSSCRMRDIQELFFDTGIGKEGYSLIGQGQVEKILNGKPEERRELFDEAAGIVKYKHRKASAVKKLEEEQANLVRINDILAELTRQVGPMKKQAETARAFLSKRDELKRYDANLFLIESAKFETTISESTERLDQAKAEMKETEEALSNAKTRYEALEGEISRAQSEISKATSDETASRLQVQEFESQITRLTDQISTLDGSDENLRARSETAARELSQRKLQLESSRKRLTELESSKSTGQEDIKKEQELQDQLQKEIAEIQSVIDQEKGEIIRILNERSSIRSGSERQKAMLEQLSLRESQLNSRELTLKSTEKEENASREGLRGEKKSKETEVEDLKSRMQRLKVELEEAQDAFQNGQKSLEGLRGEVQRESARYDTLTAITERYEGYGGSIRRVMEQKSRIPGILGVVADLIQTSKKYELAVETALGGSIQNIVTDNEDTAKRMIAFLKENRFGRATFLPLTAMQGKPFGQKEVLSENGAIGLASSLVRFDSMYAGLVDYLLGRTVVVDSIDHAVLIARKYHYSLRLVTVEGELLSPGGSMAGGAFKSQSNLLGRRREIEELAKQLGKKRDALDKLEKEVEEAHTQRNTLRDEIAAVSGLIEKNRYGIGTLDVEMKNLEGKIEETQNAFAALRKERAEIERERESILKLEGEARERLAKSGEAEQAANERISEASEKLGSLSKEAQDSAGRLTAMHVDMAGASQERNFVSQNITRLTEEISRYEEEQESIREAFRENEGARADKQEEITLLRGKISSEKEAGDRIREDLHRLGEEKAQREKEQKTFFEKREELAGRNSLLDKEVFRLEEQLEKARESLEKGRTYLWEEYELTAIACRALREEELGSVTAIRKRIGVLRTEIKNLGPVNVNAIEEFKELDERHTFLKGQHDDLVKSAADLEKIIEELDEGMRTRFQEQFLLIQREFDHTFRALFGGGKGTLELVEGEDILEAGIRVIAQPPGKKLQNMMQLSGGEKSLTAIALLFAIQNLKPSPFCLLDEIESALDENNVDRYAKYLSKLTKHTQFIIITHRRGSMAAADRLYGITMQEKGVSALVSVDLVQDDLT